MMYKHKLYFLVSLFAIAGLLSVESVQAQEQSFTLEGKVKNIDDGKKVYLKKAPETGQISPPGHNSQPIDSTTVSGDRFIFQGVIDYPQYYAISFESEKTNSDSKLPSIQPTIGFFMEGGDIQVEIDYSKLAKSFREYLQQDAKGSYEDISGSASEKLLQKFKQGIKPLEQKRSDIRRNDYWAYLTPDSTEEQGPVTEGISIVNRIDEATAERDAYVKNFIADNSDSFVALRVARNYLGKYSLEEINDIVAMFSDDIRRSAAWPDFIEEAERVKQTAVGAQFADATLRTPEGKKVKISDYVGNGNYVQLEFWASWCGPCRAQVPHLKKVYKNYHPEGYQIVNISMDGSEEAWRKAMKEEQMAWPQLWNPEAFNDDLSEKYNFRGIPFAVLIGPDGEILSRQMRGSWLDRMLIKLYGNKFTQNQ